MVTHGGLAAMPECVRIIFQSEIQLWRAKTSATATRTAGSRIVSGMGRSAADTTRDSTARNSTGPDGAGRGRVVPAVAKETGGRVSSSASRRGSASRGVSIRRVIGGGRARAASGSREAAGTPARVDTATVAKAVSAAARAGLAEKADTEARGTDRRAASARATDRRVVSVRATGRREIGRAHV